MEFDQARRHHREVSKHIVRAQRGPESLHDERNVAAAIDNLLKRRSGRRIPFPRVAESHRLSDVVILITFEWWIEINEVDTFVADVVAKNCEVVGTIEGVFHDPGARQNHSKKAKIHAL